MHYLHSMIRTDDPESSIRFYTQGIGLKLIRKNDYSEGRFSLIFLGETADGPLIELTHNWDARVYHSGDQFGHLAFSTADIYAACMRLQHLGVEILRPPRDGRMAFVKDPNGISIEILQRGEALEPQAPWVSMRNRGHW